MSILGRPINRVDGRLKVTGAARYAADHIIDGLAYGMPVMSTIGRGKIRNIDSRRAEQQPGFLKILTRQNTPAVHPTANDFGSWTKLGEARLLFADDEVYYVGQY